MKQIVFLQVFFLLFLQAFFLPFSFSQNALSTEEYLRQCIEYLASDELNGRVAGTKEGWNASKYIHDELEKTKLKPLYKNGYQGFAIQENTKRISDLSATYEDINIHSNKDVVSFYKYARQDTFITAPIVFAGFGRTKIAHHIASDTIDDYQNINVEGKWVMCFLSDYHFVPPSENNCVGMIYIMEDTSETFIEKIKEIDSSFRFLTFTDLTEYGILSGKMFVKDNELHSLAISTNLAKRILSKNNIDYDALFIRAIKENVSCDLQGLFTYSIKTESKIHYYRNVVFLLEGNDPILKNEYIVLGAHYDHIQEGFSTKEDDKYGDNIFNGADDNASGCAAILELARRFSVQKNDLKRSIIFAIFDFEEGGLHGSRFFVNHLPEGITINQIKTMINLDMIGRLNPEKKLSIGNIGSAEKGEKIMKNLVKKQNIPYKLSTQITQNSDHYNFYSKNIPIVFLTTGLHEDYHRVGDEADKINYPYLASIVDFCYDMLLYLNKKPLKIIKKKPNISFFKQLY